MSEGFTQHVENEKLVRMEAVLREQFDYFKKDMTLYEQENVSGILDENHTSTLNKILAIRQLDSDPRPKPFEEVSIALKKYINAFCDQISDFIDTESLGISRQLLERVPIDE